MNARILYVITDLEIGGVPLHLHRLAVAMRSRGFDVTVVSLASAGPVGQRLQTDGIRVLSCEGKSGWDARVVPRLARIIQTESPDLIHALLFHANLASRWAAAQATFPAQRVICEIQTVEVEQRWHLWVDRLSYDGCRFIIGNSPSVIGHLTTHANIPRERLRLVRGGIDPDPIRRAEPLDRTALSLPPDSKMILWVGRLDPVKGLRVLFDAFARVPARYKAHVCLAGGGPLHDELIAHAKRLSIDQRVQFLGPRDDIPRLLKSCDLFVFPSRTEGLPNALLEAMAAACPIITTDVPGCRDLIHHNETGLFVPYGNTAALASAITLLLTDAPLANRLGEAASASVDQHWHIRDTLDAYEAAYHDALADSLVR